MSTKYNQPKYKFYQKVWVIVTKSVWVKTSCNICNRTGKITVNDEVFTCPKCKGGSESQRHTRSVNWGLVKGIDGEVEEDGLEYKVYYEYMVCSHNSSYSENNVFGTEAEAKEALKQSKRIAK